MQVTPLSACKFVEGHFAGCHHYVVGQEQGHSAPHLQVTGVQYTGISGLSKADSGNVLNDASLHPVNLAAVTPAIQQHMEAVNVLMSQQTS